MSKDNTSGSPLIEHLQRLADREDRAALAALRSSLREGRELEALPIVLPFLGRNARRQGEDDAALVAGLFALHPNSGSHSIAEVLRIVRRETGSESIEGRFRAMLGASRSDLGPHLRHAVSLVASKHLAIDWNDLYRAIRYWNHEDDFARRKWARDFWAGPEDVKENPAAATTSTP